MSAVAARCSGVEPSAGRLAPTLAPWRSSSSGGRGAVQRRLAVAQRVGRRAAQRQRRSDRRDVVALRRGVQEAALHPVR